MIGPDPVNDWHRCRVVKVVLEDGNWFETRINGTRRDIERHYLDQKLNMAPMGSGYDKMVRVKKIVFLA